MQPRCGLATIGIYDDVDAAINVGVTCVTKQGKGQLYVYQPRRLSHSLYRPKKNVTL